MSSVKNYDLIPLSHKCVTCGRNKEVVNFYVVVNEDKARVKPQCNRCTNIGIKVPKNSKGLLVVDNRIYDVKYDIKHQIDMYFKGYKDA